MNLDLLKVPVRKDPGAVFFVVDGRAYVRAEGLIASTPVDMDDCVIPAKRFLDAYARSGARVKITDKRVTVTAGNNSVRIARSNSKVRRYSPIIPDSDNAHAFKLALGDVLPFTEVDDARPGLGNVGVYDGYFMATQGHIAARTLSPFPLPFKGTIPREYAQVLAGFDVKHYGFDSNVFIAWLDDGCSWVCAAVPGESARMPIGQVAKLLLTRDFDPEWGISEEWRKAVLETIKFSSGTVNIGPDQITATDGDDEAIGHVETRGAALLSPKYLQTVIDVSSHMDLTAYPDPIPFRGPLVCGLLCGVLRG